MITDFADHSLYHMPSILYVPFAWLLQSLGKNVMFTLSLLKMNLGITSLRAEIQLFWNSSRSDQDANCKIMTERQVRNLAIGLSSISGAVPARDIREVYAKRSSHRGLQSNKEK